MVFPSTQLDLGKLADDNPSSEFQEQDSSDIRVHQDLVIETKVRSKLEKDQQELFFGDVGDVDNFYVDFSSPPFQDLFKGTRFHSKDYEKDSPFASRSRKLNDEKIHVRSWNSEIPEVKDQKLSTNARIRLAGQWFIESCSSKVDEISQLSHQFAVSFSGLSDDEGKDIELLHTLLVSADKTGQRQFDHASKLIELCNNMSTTEGNPVERLVYYFSEAIREKINREMGRMACDELGRMPIFDLQEASTSVEASMFAFHQRVPLAQVSQFSAIHTILENVREATKVHIIDLQIRGGIKYADMLPALASRCEHVQHIKITAIGTRAESKIRDTGKRLADLAESMNIPFSFKIVMIADVLDFNIDLLELDDDEKVAVYSPYFLSTLIAIPNRLEYLMRMIRKINPCVTVITEVEANHTSPAFVNRFTEALFFYGALFDSMSCCLANEDLNRKVSESVFYGQCIRNIVAAEGDKRTIRHIGIDVWRAFYARFGMLEIELSAAALFEAKSLISNFDCGSSCSLHVDGGSLLVDWKDVPVFSVSAWKFV